MAELPEINIDECGKCYDFSVEDHPFKAHIDGPAAQMFDTLGRYSTPLYRVIVRLDRHGYRIKGRFGAKL